MSISTLAQEQEELLFTILKEQLRDLTRAYNLKQLIAKIGKERFDDARESIFGFLEQSCGAELSRNEQLALLGQMFKCLTRYIGAMGLPVTLKTFFDHIGLLAYAVDLAFPGYSDAGLLRAVISPSRLPIPLRKAG